ncbi:hypothetical protein EPUS_00318 [Endocarpon pusillum Z07020]|uniref:Cytochrome P450 n=1 Tax=Endocarpon pusillum (strain Z07020 / HMAS-L-300199) TaxID=1263415 RepID=U1GEK2_ENDPU|nr:uncharacterized protein EPUS_00318 [Endocarpon pusillum Z07020]ERF70131.1 hypothetical protein EPUS_00318 [Endocarpon pusillum Z07020]
MAVILPTAVVLAYYHTPPSWMIDAYHAALPPVQPKPPHHPILGHLLIARDFVNTFPPDAHAHVYADYIRRKYNLGKFFYLDFWPLNDQFLYIADPDIANQITIGSSLRKSPMVPEYMNVLLGNQNMVCLEGAAWKRVRSMFNPGFAGGHLMTLVPYIVDAAVVFGDVLREKARASEVFEMEEIATWLTMDVIGKVTLDVDLNSQRSEHRIVTTFRKHVAMMPVTTPADPFIGLIAKYFNAPWLWYNGRKLDRYIGEALDQRYAKRSADQKSRTSEDSKKKIRSVIDLALDTYEQEIQDSSKNHGSSTGEGMDPAFRSHAVDQIKTLIFAGHDTTSSTIAWAFYLLHQHPDVHAKLVEELDHVLGPKTSNPADKIRADSYLINRLPYLTAVVKETLRLFPPASTVRYGDPTVTITDPDHEPSQTYPTANFHIWVVAHAIHRNETYFPNPTAFIPERHLDDNHPSSTPFPHAKQHKDALRPFEKGPRNCIGQELAMIEVRVILALTVREFDFEAVYPELRDPREVIEGHRCYQVLKGSAKPKGGLPGRVTVR